MTAYWSLLSRRPAFRRLWVAELVSLIGDWFTIVAVSIVSLSAADGGVLALATSLAAHLLPQSLAAPLGGWVADRYDRRRVLLVSLLLEGAITLAMVGVFASLSVVWPLQALVAVRSVVSSAREPASGAALPSVVERSELHSANALLALTWSVTFAVGMALGGIATAVGPAIALGLDAATFFVAALIVSGVAALPPPPRETTQGPGAVVRETLEALKIANTTSLRGSIFGLAPMALIGGAGWLCLNLAATGLPLALSGAAVVGILQAIRGIGTALGPMFTTWLEARSGRRRDTAWLGAAANLVGVLAISWAPSFAVVVAGVAVWGAGAGALWVSFTTEIQSRAPDTARGRLLALFGLSHTSMMVGGAFLCALVVSSGVSSTFAVIPIATLSLIGFIAVRRGSFARNAEDLVASAHA